MLQGSKAKSGLETLVETRKALLRASVLFGTVGIVFALAVGAPQGRSERMAETGAYGVDDTMTGSVDRTDRYVSRRSVLQAPGSGPCLHFPDGSQRGAC